MLPINQNLGSLNAIRNLNKTNSLMQLQLARLSSGLRVTRAADDPAGLVISEQLRAQAAGIGQALENTQSAYNVTQIAEGALDETSNLLSRARELAIASANTGAQTAGMVEANQQELDNILAAIDRTAETTEFDDQQLLDGTADLQFQVGPGTDAGDQVGITIPDMGTANLGSTSGDALDTLRSGGANDLAANPTRAVEVIDAAVREVTDARGSIGAFQKNTLETNLNSMRVAFENVTATESTIRDLDFAEGASAFVNLQTLARAGLGALGASNVQSQSVLRLLGS